MELSRKKKSEDSVGLRRKIKGIVPYLLVMVGIVLACYPWISNFINSRQAASAVSTYERKTGNDSKEKRIRELKKAREYNRSLIKDRVRITDPFKKVLSENQRKYPYWRILNTDGSGVMGWIRIPAIGVRLPLYHGTSDAVLRKGVGHIQGTSLPVGGKSTHAVLTSHTGLTKARLFSDLPKLKKGDLLFIYVCGKTLVYKVNRSYVIKPDELESLRIVSGKDMVTLLTCYPYGVNTHRLCVQAMRTEYKKQDRKMKDKIPTDSRWMKEYGKALIWGLLVSAGILAVSKKAGKR